MSDVTDFLAERFPDLRDIRRDIHAHPELGFRETRTAALIAGRLRAAGYKVTEGIAQTGLVATLKRGDGPVIGLRADMDALPMDEQTNLPHASKTEGVFHGCGHDGHTTSLLATAEALAAHGNFSGTVHLIFQPAEEGLAGGLKMVEEGLFDRFPCDRIYGFHNMPLLPMGQAAVRPGPAMASADGFILRFTGKGGHAAMPHLSRDVALLCSELTLAFQSLISRGINPLHSAVLSVTQIHVGSAHNVIAGEGWMSGTVRCLDPEDRALLEAGLRALVEHHCAARGISVDIEWINGYPPLTNDPAAAAQASKVLSAQGSPVSCSQAEPLMAAEDFSYMLNKIPGAYIFFGMAVEGEDNPMVHHPAYDFRDELIPIIAESMVRLVEAELPA
ncbi:amidohydrolase [Pseudooceanicola algae]|uniref:Hippurate hydrolase n=1 Tax=Pseudooceanicola algae TaxID=1537215 RepID=A0A418SFG4_9RHOB|nr:amidohydrolase [Pseudooceanicola algae]QPM89174.1 Hippurate hydrolase [Pseudooceanicola algae]